MLRVGNVMKIRSSSGHSVYSSLKSLQDKMPRDGAVDGPHVGAVLLVRRSQKTSLVVVSPKHVPRALLITLDTEGPLTYSLLFLPVSRYGGGSPSATKWEWSLYSTLLERDAVHVPHSKSRRQAAVCCPVEECNSRLSGRSIIRKFHYQAVPSS